LWGPDEFEKMRTVGNLVAQEVYGAEKIDPTASKEQKQRYVMEKYDKRSFAHAAAPTPKATLTAFRNEKAKPSIPPTQAESSGQMANSTVLPPFEHGLDMRQGVPPAARKADIPDAFFDELFNEPEDSYLTKSSTVLKPPCMDVAQTIPAHSSHVHNNLDDFLNSTLYASVLSAPTALPKWSASLDPWLQPQKTFDADPFSDWPIF